MPPHQGRVRRPLFAIGLLLLLAGCAEPRPVLYPDARYHAAGPDRIESDVRACRDMAEAAGASGGDDRTTRVATQTATGAAVGGASGGAVGAITGSPGQGAAIGAVGAATAGFVKALLRPPRPSGTYRNFTNRCLAERGYDVVGWE